MQKSAIGIKNKSAFTLIEILVVVLIIGITLTFVVMAFGDFGASRQARVSAEECVAYLQLLQEQAILESNTLGLKIEEHTVKAYRFTATEQWQSMANQQIFRDRLLPHKVITQLTPAQSSITPDPQIIIQPSGDLSPFKLTFGTHDKPDIVSIIGKHDGQITLDPL